MKRLWEWIFWIWLIVFFSLTSYPKLHMPQSDRIALDKVAHLVMYAGIAYTYYRMRGMGMKVLREILLLAALLPALDEIHQIPIPGRQCSILDWFADIIGIALVLLPVYWVERTRRRRTRSFS